MSPFEALEMPPSVRAHLETLRLAYLNRLCDRLEEWRRCERVMADPSADATSETRAAPSDWAPASIAEETHRLVHSLAGSGATFGLPEVSRAARELDLAFKDAARSERPTNALWWQSLASQRADLEKSLLSALEGRTTAPASPADHFPATPPSSNARVSAPFLNLTSGGIDGGSGEIGAVTQRQFALSDTDQIVASAAGSALLSPLPRCVHLLVQDSGDVAELRGALEAFGLRVSVPANQEQWRASLGEGKPVAIIALSPGGPLQATLGSTPLCEALGAARRERALEAELPVIWVCGDDSLGARLQAVEQGGRAFLTHPADADALIEHVEALSWREDDEPFRVLVVDDEPALTRLYALLLRESGCEVVEVNDPFLVMGPLVDFRPDLLLMDLYMEACDGAALSEAIRQQEAFVSLPIVYLSGERDLDRQFGAMSRAGDEFLIKPIEPRHLISVVRARAERGRALRALMERDSLTGLLNHARFKERLRVELSRVERSGTPASLVMIDIDRFKSVNDVHGHGAGDRVIKALARVLSGRLRSTDLIGRYGGEEFAVVLCGTTATQAANVVEELRRAFAGLTHRSPRGEFCVTFSAGIAVAPPHCDPDALSERADRALYRAKEAGRDRVIIDNDPI